MDTRDFSADSAVEFVTLKEASYTRDERVLNIGYQRHLPLTYTRLGEFPDKPSGLLGVLEYFKQSYGNPPVYIHENGQGMRRNATLNDTPRVEYLRDYIGAVLDAVRNGSNARGYFTWSFLDVFEILDGFEAGYGLYYVDLDDKDLKRYPKLSAHWYSKFLKGGSISLDGENDVNKDIFAASQSHSSW